MRALVHVSMLALLLTVLGGCLGPGDKIVDDAAATPLPGSPVLFGPGAADATPAFGVPQFQYSGFSGAEPNMGITSSGNIYMTAFDDTIKSTDGGRTWTSVYNYDLIQGLVERGTNDPMLWVDTDTDRIYTNHMVGTQCFVMVWSDDEGGTWTQRDMACVIPVVDHQKVITSHPGPEMNVQAMAGLKLYPNVLYTCYNAAIGNQCFASFDGGYTYTQEAVTMGSDAPCSGVAGHPAAAPDGTIAVAAGWNCGPVVSHSRDSGMTWTWNEGPQEFGVGASIDPDLAFLDDGTLFLMYRDGDHMVRLARTSDYGETWDAVWNLTSPGLTSTRFHVLSAGDDGRMALAYLGTDHPSPYTWMYEGEEQTWEGAPIDAPPTAPWHLYIVTVVGADTDAPVFTSYQVTPDDDPVQVGCSWEGGGGGGARTCRNMLDFIDSAVHPDGTFYVTYTEGCTVREECAPLDPAKPPGEDASRDREVAAAWLEGWSLRGDA